MDDKTIAFIQETAWFKNLPTEVTKQLADKMIEHYLEPEDALINKGDTDDSVYILQEGWVKIVIPDEKEGDVTLNHLGPGEFVGELSLVDQKPRSASVVALSTVRVLELKRIHFLETIEQHPMLGLHVIINLSQRMRFALTYLEKSIQWSHKIAEGDYDFMRQELDENKGKLIVDHEHSEDARVRQFLSAFFEMVEGVQAREELLLNKVHELTIHFDKEQRDAELESLLESKFFKQLKSDTVQLKDVRKRKDD